MILVHRVYQMKEEEEEEKPNLVLQILHHARATVVDGHVSEGVTIHCPPPKKKNYSGPGLPPSEYKI